MDYLTACVKDYKHSSIISKRVFAVLVSDGFPRDYLNGAWHSVFYNQIMYYLNQNNKNYIHLEFKHNYFTPRYTLSKYIQPYFDYLTIKNIILQRYNTVVNETMDCFDEFTNFLKLKDLGIQIPRFDRIRDQTKRILSMSYYYEGLFKKAMPSICFFVCYYNNYGMAFNLACRRLGIPSVDIQHGFQGELHPAYGKWNRVPVTGYELLPSYFWVWSKKEEEAILKWASDVSNWHKPVIGGNLWLEFWRKGQDDVVTLYDHKVHSIKKENPGSINVLITLQIRLSTYDILKEVIDVIRRTQNDWFWWIRLPSTMLNERKRIRKLLNSNGVRRFDLDHATEFPLYSLLRNVDVHVTYGSSTVLEAEAFSVPSVIISDYSDELFADQIQSGVVIPAYVSDNIHRAIKEQFRKKYDLSGGEGSASNSFVGIGEILNRIVAGKQCLRNNDG